MDTADRLRKRNHPVKIHRRIQAADNPHLPFRCGHLSPGTAATTEPRLKRLRLTAGLSQSDLAERTGLNLRTLQHYEQGSKDIRRAAGETLLVLARALSTSIESLLD